MNECFMIEETLDFQTKKATAMYSTELRDAGGRYSYIQKNMAGIGDHPLAANG